MTFTPLILIRHLFSISTDTFFLTRVLKYFNFHIVSCSVNPKSGSSSWHKAGLAEWNWPHSPVGVRTGQTGGQSLVTLRCETGVLPRRPGSVRCRWRFTPAALPSPLTFSPSSSLQLSDQHSPVPSRAAGVGSQGTVPSWAVSGSTPYLKPGPAGQGTVDSRDLVSTRPSSDSVGPELWCLGGGSLWC